MKPGFFSWAEVPNRFAGRRSTVCFFAHFHSGSLTGELNLNALALFLLNLEIFDAAPLDRWEWCVLCFFSPSLLFPSTFSLLELRCCEDRDLNLLWAEPGSLLFYGVRFADSKAVLPLDTNVAVSTSLVGVTLILDILASETCWLLILGSFLVISLFTSFAEVVVVVLFMKYINII